VKQTDLSENQSITKFDTFSREDFIKRQLLLEDENIRLVRENYELRNINLTKIESRPIPKQPWKYYFYIDFLGSENHENIKNAISNLKEYCTMIKVLGSYKIAKK
jgi:prephenate dehydratase